MFGGQAQSIGTCAFQPIPSAFLNADRYDAGCAADVRRLHSFNGATGSRALHTIQKSRCATSERYKQALACPHSRSRSQIAHCAPYRSLMEDTMITRRAFYHTLSPADRITVAK